MALLMGLTLSTAPTTAEAANPGWSSAPRWNLPKHRPPACKRWKHRRGLLTRLGKAKCAEETPPTAKSPTPSPQPGVTPPRPVPPTTRPTRPQPAPTAAPRPRPSPRPSSPRPDLRGYPDANALMAMNTRQCHAYLRQSEVPFTPVSRREARSVDIPVRISGPIAGVTWRIPWSENEATDIHTIWDCRTVAAMVPFTRWLASYGVVEIAYFSSLRGGKAALAKPRSQHNVGLAVDFLGFRRAGEDLAKVEQNYRKRRLRSCPQVAAAPPDRASASEIYHALVCEAVRHGLLHTILTPDHDRAHYNHLHLDLKADQRSPVDPYVSLAGR